MELYRAPVPMSRLLKVGLTYRRPASVFALGLAAIATPFVLALVLVGIIAAIVIAAVANS